MTDERSLPGLDALGARQAVRPPRIGRRWFCTVGVVASVIGAVAAMWFGSPVHRAEATVTIRSTAIQQVLATSVTVEPDVINIGDGLTIDQRLRNEIVWLESDRVRSYVAGALGLASVPAVVGVPSDDGASITVRVDASAPRAARAAANSFAESFVRLRSEQLADVAATATDLIGSRIEELESASDEGAVDSERTTLTAALDEIESASASASTPAQVLTEASTSRRRLPDRAPAIIVAAAFAGLLSGLLAAAGAERVGGRIRSIDDLAAIARRRPVVGVPHDDAAGAELELELEQNPIARALDALCDIWRARGVLPSVVQVAPRSAGDGATTIAVNLAVALADAGSTVVVVDSDVHDPHVHRLLGVDGSFGVAEVVSGEDLDLALLPLDDRISVLTSGTWPHASGRRLAEPDLEALVLELRQRFDCVIVDTPPMSAGDDSPSILRSTESFVLVVGAGRTSARDPERAVDRLDRSGAPIDCFVLNRAVGGSTLQPR